MYFVALGKTFQRDYVFNAPIKIPVVDYGASCEPPEALLIIIK